MSQNRPLKALLILTAIGALTYVAISLFLPSPRKMIFGIDRQTGDIRLVQSGVTFLPPHNYRRVSFVKRQGAAQTAGLTQTRSRENIPIRIAYRIRFDIRSSRLPDARRIVIDGWDSWFNARVAEAVRAFTSRVEVEELIAPTSRYNAVRQQLQQAVVQHLGQSGIEVSAFQIESLTIDRDALLAHKRQELRRRARAPVSRIAMFGIDGADWDLIDDLVDAGRMPNLEALIRAGAKAEVRSIQPLVTPLVWATLSTGTPPSRHGIVDFFEQTSQRSPVTSRSRNAPAIWEIAAGFGRPTLVDDWWTAWPPLRTEPKIVTPGGQQAGLEQSDAAAIASLRISPETVGYPQISRFAEVSQSEWDAAREAADPREPLVILQRALARTWSDHRVGLELYQRTQPMLFMLGFPAADEIHHVFGPFHPPGRASVDYQLRQRYYPVVTNYYIELDRLLGEWVQVLPDETTVMIVSAHGHRWDGGRPSTLPFDRADLSSHRDRGVFIVSGNRVEPSRSMRSIDLVDLAPTVLGILGLPAAEEMPGSFRAEFFEGIEPIETVHITSYNDVIELDRRSPHEGIVDPRNYLAELTAVGHVSSRERQQRGAPSTPPQRGAGWGEYAWNNNHGARLAGKGDLDEAVDALERAAQLQSDRHVPYLNLAMIVLKRQRFTSAESLLWKAIEAGAPEPESLVLDMAAWYRENDMTTRAIQLLAEGRERYPDSYDLLTDLGSALAAAERYTDAIPVLEDALGLQPTSTRVLNNLGAIYADREDYGRALDYWNRSLEISPRQPQISEAARAAVSRL